MDVSFLLGIPRIIVVKLKAWSFALYFSLQKIYCHEECQSEIKAENYHREQLDSIESIFTSSLVRERKKQTINVLNITEKKWAHRRLDSGEILLESNEWVLWRCEMNVYLDMESLDTKLFIWLAYSPLVFIGKSTNVPKVLMEVARMRHNFKNLRYMRVSSPYSWNIFSSWRENISLIQPKRDFDGFQGFFPA